MHKILEIKTWMVFVILVLPSLFNVLSDDTLTKVLLSVTAFLVRTGYYLFIYETCNQKIKESNSAGYYLSLAALFLYFTGIQVIPGISEMGIGANLLISLFGVGVSFYSLYRLSTIYILFTEGERALNFGTYVSIFIQLTFLMLGIWVVHPTIRRVVEKNRMNDFSTTQDSL